MRKKIYCAVGMSCLDRGGRDGAGVGQSLFKKIVRGVAIDGNDTKRYSNRSIRTVRPLGKLQRYESIDGHAMSPYAPSTPFAPIHLC